MSKEGKTEIRLSPGGDDTVIINARLWGFLWWTPVGNAANSVNKAITDLNELARKGHQLLNVLQEAEEDLKSIRSRLKEHRYDTRGISKPYFENNSFIEMCSGSLSNPEPTYKAFINPAVLSKYKLSKASTGNRSSGPQKPSDPNGKRVVVTPKGQESKVRPSDLKADSSEGWEGKNPENNRKNQKGNNQNSQRNNGNSGNNRNG